GASIGLPVGWGELVRAVPLRVRLLRADLAVVVPALVTGTVPSVGRLPIGRARLDRSVFGRVAIGSTVIGSGPVRRVLVVLILVALIPLPPVVPCLVADCVALAERGLVIALQIPARVVPGSGLLIDLVVPVAKR